MATVDDFISKLKSQLGKPYVFGAADPNVGFDCSGLIHWALKQLGLNYTHQSESMINETRKIGTQEAINTKGALLYYYGHIVVSLGNGQIIEAPVPGQNVRIVNLYDESRWECGGIVSELTNTPTQEKEIKVKTYTKRDAKADAGNRSVLPDKYFYLHTNASAGDSNAINVIGAVGNYDITVQAALAGTPGDVIGIRYLLQETATGKNLAFGPWNDTTIPPRGYIATTSNFKRAVPSGSQLFIQLKSSAVAKGTIKVTNLVSDAFLFVSA